MFDAALFYERVSNVESFWNALSHLRMNLFSLWLIENSLILFLSMFLNFLSLESSLNLKLFEFASNVKRMIFFSDVMSYSLFSWMFITWFTVLSPFKSSTSWEHCTKSPRPSPPRRSVHYWSPPLWMFHVDISDIEGSDGYDWLRLTGDMVAVLLLLLLGLLFAVLLLGLLLLLLALFSVLVRFCADRMTSSTCGKCCRGPGSGV